MPFFQLFVVAAVLGLTQFIPVSSAAHFALLGRLIGPLGDDRVLLVGIHFGVMLAALAYFAGDIFAMVRAIGRMPRQMTAHRPFDKEFWLFVNLVIASLPVIAASYLVMRYDSAILHRPDILAWTTLGLGVLLLIVDQTFMTICRIEHISVGGALLIGVLQSLAVVPGVGRAAMSLMATRLLGVERPDAARFSFLLTVPVMAGLIAVESLGLLHDGAAVRVAVLRDAAIGGGIAFVVAVLAITFVMSWVRRGSFTAFALYRLAIGAVLVVALYGLPFKLF